MYHPCSRVTREHREKLAKSANAIFVKCKAAVKEVQIKYNKKLDLRTVDERISVEQMRLIREQVRNSSSYYARELNATTHYFSTFFFFFSVNFTS